MREQALYVQAKNKWHIVECEAGPMWITLCDSGFPKHRGEVSNVRPSDNRVCVRCKSIAMARKIGAWAAVGPTYARHSSFYTTGIINNRQWHIAQPYMVRPEHKVLAWCGFGLSMDITEVQLPESGEPPDNICAKCHTQQQAATQREQAHSHTPSTFWAGNSTPLSLSPEM